MSIQFNDTSTYKGLVQIYEKEIGVPRTTVSGDADLLKEFTADANITLDEFTSRAIQASGKWQYDDSTHTKYPVIYTNLVSGQRDYQFTTDQQGNLILDIYEVLILPTSSATLYQKIWPIDAQSTESNITSENTATGVPYQYDKTANAIFLDPTPSYNATNGLKIYINRESSYFDSGDTTKKPGIPGVLHEYVALKPALKYAGRKSLSNYTDLFNRVSRMEKMIDEYFGKREKDDQPYLQSAEITGL